MTRLVKTPDGRLAEIRELPAAFRASGSCDRCRGDADALDAADAIDFLLARVETLEAALPDYPTGEFLDAAIDIAERLDARGGDHQYGIDTTTLLAHLRVLREDAVIFDNAVAAALAPSAAEPTREEKVRRPRFPPGGGFGLNPGNRASS